MQWAVRSTGDTSTVEMYSYVVFAIMIAHRQVHVTDVSDNGCALGRRPLKRNPREKGGWFRNNPMEVTKWKCSLSSWNQWGWLSLARYLPLWDSVSMWTCCSNTHWDTLSAADERDSRMAISRARRKTLESSSQPVFFDTKKSVFPCNYRWIVFDFIWEVKMRAEAVLWLSTNRN